MTSAGTMVLGLDCSPVGKGRTSTALEAILAACAAQGRTTRIVHLGGEEALPTSDVLAAMRDADAFVFGSPIYRASYASPFKALLDQTPRGMWGETEAPLTGKVAAVVATGASHHHFLGLGDMREILACFFACHVVSPGLYLSHASFDESHSLDEDAAERARLQGLALVELANAVAGSSALRAVTPQA